MSENDKVVFEIDMADPSKLAFMVSELIKMVVRAAETAKVISETNDSALLPAMNELASMMSRGLKLELAGLMQALCTEVTDTTAPEVQEAIAAAHKDGIGMSVISVKQPAKILRPDFSFTAPTSQVTN